jgi:DNA (cytosine-5)-methyltransferase 1
LINEHLGYATWADEVRAEDCGVAQRRPRVFIVGIRQDLMKSVERDFDPFEILRGLRREFLEDKGLDPARPVTVEEAISDLTTKGKEKEEYPDWPGFQRIRYTGAETAYQELLRRGLNGETPDSLRLPNHRGPTVERFQRIIDECRAGVALNVEEKKRLGIRKHTLVRLRGDAPSHTLTTLPDDYVHYSEPRVLTVREMARLQSFPDWFVFKGKYTTGGPVRTQEVPRYSQVGNAVAPFVAELFGRALDEVDRQLPAEGKPS